MKAETEMEEMALLYGGKECTPALLKLNSAGSHTVFVRRASLLLNVHVLAFISIAVCSTSPGRERSLFLGKHGSFMLLHNSPPCAVNPPRSWRWNGGASNGCRRCWVKGQCVSNEGGGGNRQEVFTVLPVKTGEICKRNLTINASNRIL